MCSPEHNLKHDPLSVAPTMPLQTSQQQSTHASTVSTHSMQTRSRSGIFKPCHVTDIAQTPLMHALLATYALKGFRSVAKHLHWVAAMEEKMLAFRSNATWDLVPRPPGTNIVGLKWIFWTKHLPDGTVDCHKARLVAQGFTQLPDCDYSRTFIPVIEASTVHIILSLAII